MTVNRPLCEPVAVRMLELQPGMASKICESFKVLHLMVVEPFHDAQTEYSSSALILRANLS
jgi:hypothetical protein